MVKTLEQMTREADAAVSRVSFEEAEKLFAQGRAQPVDIREEEEFRAKPHLPGAISVPRSRLEFRAEPDSPHFDAALSTDDTLLIYCNTGGRALFAAKTLCDMGFKKVLLLGGIENWIADGGEVENPE